MSEDLILLGKMFLNINKLKGLFSESKSEERYVESEFIDLLSKLETITDTIESVETKDFLKELSQKLQQQESDLNELYGILAKKDLILVKNGKEIMSLTHEKCMLMDVIENAPNQKDLLLELDKLKQLPVV